MKQKRGGRTGRARKAKPSGKTAPGITAARPKTVKKPSPPRPQKDQYLAAATLKKTIHWVENPKEFHIITFLVALLILSSIFNSLAMLTYTALTVIVFAFGHFLHRHNHKPHDIISIFALFFLPLTFTIAIYRDVLTILIAALYLLAAISTLILYHYHKKEHRPLMIMWQVTYSKVMATTVALSLATVLPSLVLTDSFYSFYELSFAYLVPVAFAFFFMSKFLYLYFFDRKHIKHDSYLSLRHAIIYSLAFMLIVCSAYAIVAAGFYSSNTDRYDSYMDRDLQELTQIKTNIERSPAGESLAAKDLSAFTDTVFQEVSAEKARTEEDTLSFGEITDDSYLRRIMDNLYNLLRFSILKMQIVNVKAGMIDAKEIIDEQRTWPGADLIMEQEVASLKTYVEKEYISYYENPEVTEISNTINNPDAKVSDFEENGIFYWFADETGMEMLYNSDSLLGIQTAQVIKHTTIFREITRFSFNINILAMGERTTPSALKTLYDNRAGDSGESAALRYGMIASYIKGSYKPDMTAV